MELNKNDAFRARIDEMYEHMKKYDKDKIGEAFLPEVVAYDIDSHSITLRYTIQEWMMNCNGVMHGGMTATIMDNSMGWGACTMPEDGNITPTVSMSVDYLNPIPMCDHVIVEVSVTAVKRKICYVQARLYKEGEPDVLLATSTGTYYRIPYTEHVWKPIA